MSAKGTRSDAGPTFSLRRTPARGSGHLCALGWTWSPTSSCGSLICRWGGTQGASHSNFLCLLPYSYITLLQEGDSNGVSLRVSLSSGAFGFANKRAAHFLSVSHLTSAYFSCHFLLFVGGLNSLPDHMLWLPFLLRPLVNGRIKAPNVHLQVPSGPAPSTRWPSSVKATACPP